MFMGGMVGQDFIQYDLWKSLLITSIYLLSLRKALKHKSAKALVVIAVASLLICILLPLIMHGGNGQIEFSSIASIAVALLPSILVVSAVYIVILVKFISKSIINRQAYYGQSSLLGAGMAFLFFILMVVSNVLAMAISCNLNPESCSD